MSETMEHALPPNLPYSLMDVDDILFEGCWMETADALLFGNHNNNSSLDEEEESEEESFLSTALALNFPSNDLPSSIHSDTPTSWIADPHPVKVPNDSYKAALTEIVEVLSVVCKAHRLPLAQTWAPCSHQLDENHAPLLTIVDSAYYIGDPNVLGFHEACCELSLLRGQGIVGKAFTTNQPCFLSDISTKYTDTHEYPFAQHALVFGLRGAVAIRVRSTYSRSADFVLEFFLPVECRDLEDQRQMLYKLSSVLQQTCRGLYVLTDKELQEELESPSSEGEQGASNDKCTRPEILNYEPPASNRFPLKDSSWLAHMVDSQYQGNNSVLVSLERTKEEPQEEFKLTTFWDNGLEDSQSAMILQDFGVLKQDNGSVGGGSSSFGGRHSSGARKAGETRRSKVEKTISLQVLRQYFAGSLKEAAKSIGVCPTTLKRICRQHGISRWPSRKIKKVGHSLRKLQLVIDSVQGAEGSLEISSFYSNFPELNTSISPFAPAKLPSEAPSSSVRNANPPKAPKLEGGCGTTISKSPSSSCSHSSGSSLRCSSRPKTKRSPAAKYNASKTGNALLLADGSDPESVLKRAFSDAELHSLSREEETEVVARSQSRHISFAAAPTTAAAALLPRKSSCGPVLGVGNGLSVKATFGDEKVRFRLHESWGFGDLQQEISKRFHVEDMSSIQLRYLDDDSEWVLLTCDADLEECIDVYKSSQTRTIKLSLLHYACDPNLGSSFGSNCPSSGHQTFLG